MLFFLFLLGPTLQNTEAVSHSLKYFYTASSQVPNFPVYVVVGMVDDVQIIHCDSDTKKAESKQDWMSRVTEDDPDYWEKNTGNFLGFHQSSKLNVEIAKQRFNQTGGVHIYQAMYGCEWDDETGDVDGNFQFGYDGEDLIVFDLKTLTWIAPKQQAVIIKHKWDRNKAFIAQKNHFLTQYCIEWLKKYVNYGKSSLMRTEVPSVSLLQKTSSSPVSCFATGFYPRRADLFWRKDGEELHDESDVERGEILPNHDGSFQMNADLKITSVKPEDWGKYECVFRLFGLNDDIITKLDKAAIRTNEVKNMDINIITIIIIIIIVAVVVVPVAVIGIMRYNKKKDQRSKHKSKDHLMAKCPSNPSSENSSDVSDKLNPES